MSGIIEPASPPDGWTEVPLAELTGADGLFTDGDWVLKEHLQRPGNDVRLLQLGNLGVGEFSLESERWISTDVAEELGCTLLQPGDVLISRMADPLARAAVLPDLGYPCITAVDVAILRCDTDLVEPRFLMLAMNSPLMRERAERHATGTTRKRISRKNLGSLLVPLAPRAEQDRIVEVVEALMGELETGLRGLDTAELVLERFQASILAAAVAGRLTSRIETPHPGTELLDEILQEREMPQPAAEPNPPSGIELPEGWTWATVGQLAALVQYGSSTRAGKSADGVPVLRMGNIQDGRLHLNDLKYLPVDHGEFPDLLLEEGDVLFNRTNSPELVGKAAVFNGEPEPCSFASYLIRVRLNRRYRSELLVYYLNSTLGRAWVRSVVSQQVGQANVNGTKLKQLTIPVPPRAEQDAICRVADAQLRLVDETRETIGEARARAEALRHGILEAVFSGRLIPRHASSAVTHQPGERATVAS